MLYASRLFGGAQNSGAVRAREILLRCSSACAFPRKDPRSQRNRSGYKLRSWEAAEHPDAGADTEVEYVNSPDCRPEYARGSVEWQRQQEGNQ